MSDRIKGIAMAATGAIFWGSSGIAGQYLLNVIGFSPEWLSSFRMLTAGILLLIFDITQNRQNIFEILKKQKLKRLGNIRSVRRTRSAIYILRNDKSK